jgi:hypothetical protein
LQKQPGNYATAEAKPRTGVKKRPTNKGIGAAHQFCHQDLVSPVFDRQPHGVANHQNNRCRQKNGQRPGGAAQQFGHGIQPLQPAQINLNLLNAIHTLHNRKQRLNTIGSARPIAGGNQKRMGKRVVVQIIKRILKAGRCPEFIQRSIAVNQFNVGHPTVVSQSLLEQLRLIQRDVLCQISGYPCRAFPSGTDPLKAGQQKHQRHRQCKRHTHHRPCHQAGHGGLPESAGAVPRYLAMMAKVAAGLLP